MTDRFDVIIIGTGAGGGTLAHKLAPTGKKILLLERGDFLTREMANWDPGAVFVDGRYISPDTWHDKDGKPFQPQVHYFVGGATKMYGAALYRLRPADFGEIKYSDPRRAIRQLERDQRLRDHGYKVIHFTWRELFQTPRAVIERVRKAFASPSPV